MLFSNNNEIGRKVNKLQCFKVILKDIQHSNMGHYSQDRGPVCRNCNYKAQMNLMMPGVLQAMLT